MSLYTDTALPEIDGQTVILDPPFTYSSPFLNADYDSHIISITDQWGEEIVMDFTQAYTAGYLAGDINKDGYVNLADIAIFASQWQQSSLDF